MTEADEALLLAARAWIDGDPDPAHARSFLGCYRPEQRAALTARSSR